MNLSKKIIVFIFILLGNVNLHPSTGRDVEIKCPLCDSTVSYWKQFSYSIFTYGLDLKPMGAARIPQPIPRCKNCGFVFMEDYFTDEEIKILKNHIINQKVFSQKENYPDYYYLAFASELLDSKDYEDMVYFYVCSVQNLSRNHKREAYGENNFFGGGQYGICPQLIGRLYVKRGAQGQ